MGYGSIICHEFMRVGLSLYFCQDYHSIPQSIRNPRFEVAKQIGLSQFHLDVMRDHQAETFWVCYIKQERTDT